MENISTKEWLISIIVVLLTLSLVVLIEPTIKDSSLDEIKVYERSLKINGDAVSFQYAHKTNVGDVLAYGTLKSLEPQSIPELVGHYGMIEKVKEHYTMHSRQVSHENCSGTGNNRTCTTYYTTEYYWTWDVVHRDYWNSQKYDFLGVIFPLTQLDISAIQRLELSADTMSKSYDGFYDKWDLYENKSVFGGSGDDRYSFYVLPLGFQATLFVGFYDDKIVDPINHGNKLVVNYVNTPEQVIQHKKDSLFWFDVIYYLTTLILVGVIYFFWAYNFGEVE